MLLELGQHRDGADLGWIDRCEHRFDLVEGLPEVGVQFAVERSKVCGKAPERFDRVLDIVRKLDLAAVHRSPSALLEPGMLADICWHSFLDRFGEFLVIPGFVSFALRVAALLIKE